MKQSESLNLYNSIIAIVDSTYTNKHVSHFFNISANIAFNVLNRKIQIYNHYFPIIASDNSTIRDESKSMISILFNRNEKNEFVELQEYFLPKLDEIGKNKEKSIPYLKQLIQSKIRQELVNRFKQEDIEGYRLYRNILMAPKRNSKIGIFNIGYKKYYFFNDGKLQLNEVYNKNEKQFSREQLEEWCKEVNKSFKTAPDIVLNILKKCKKHKGTQNFISITDLLSTIKNSYKPQKNENEFSISVSNSASTLNDNEISIISVKLKLAIEDKLVKTYVQKRKANQLEKDIYTEIIMNYFEDLFGRGESLQLQNYIEKRVYKNHLKNNWPVHRSRIEYLIKHGKKVLKDIIIPI